MNTKTKNYNVQILSSIEKYLLEFPDELEKLNTLINQLKTDDQEIFSRKNFRGHLTGSGLFYYKQFNKVLLVHHRSLNIWIQPGGHLDQFEDPKFGALREFQEETKIQNVKVEDCLCPQNIPIDIDTHFIPANPKKDEPEHFHHDFLYLLTVDDKSLDNTIFAITISEEELKDYKWVDLDALESGDFEEKLKRTARKIKTYFSK